ncbi:MAG: nucleotide pyrophosphohydrolase [Thioalkalivibrio sp.]|nr:nucleotide pyrophosphohydrolase [Thioalkalivibrio sp.]
MSTVAALTSDLRAFTRERDWEQFHSLKNLSASVAIEAGELLELFQWRDPSPADLDAPDRERLEDELADVFIYVLRLADVASIDVLEAAQAKLAKNAAKYPVAKSRGNAKKYTEFEE